MTSTTSASLMGQAAGALSAAAALVAEARQDFDRLDRDLVAHLDQARSAWSGRGGSAFLSLGATWAQQQRAIVGALDRFEDSLRSTERDNTDTDEVQSTAFTQQLRRLG